MASFLIYIVYNINYNCSILFYFHDICFDFYMVCNNRVMKGTSVQFEVEYMGKFKIHSNFKPTDQPQAIEKLSDGIFKGLNIKPF